MTHPNLGLASHLNPYPHISIPFNLVGSVDAADNAGSTLQNPKASGSDKLMALLGLGGNAGLSAVEMYGVAAPTAGMLAEAQEASALSRSLSDCFVSGTLIQTVSTSPQGNKALHEGNALKPIEQIRKGDLVLTRNEKTGKSEVKKVLNTTILSAPAVVTLFFADTKTHKIVETITATREHPFFVQGVGFVIAGRLALGNAIVTRAGPSLTVAKIEWKQGKQAVYNFEVEEDRSNFVESAKATMNEKRAQAGLECVLDES